MEAKLPVTTITLHPKKKVGLLLGVVINFVLAICFVHLFAGLDRMPGKVLTTLLFLAAVGAFIFHIAAYLFLRREKFVGFFISSDGLNDISTGNNYGVVYWEDVVKIRVAEDMEHPKYQYIVLKVRDPQQYIDREPSIAKKRSLMLKYHYYGSPVCFSNRGLNCTFEELEACVRKYYANYQTRASKEVVTF